MLLYFCRLYACINGYSSIDDVISECNLDVFSIVFKKLHQILNVKLNHFCFLSLFWFHSVFLIAEFDQAFEKIFQINDFVTDFSCFFFNFYKDSMCRTELAL